MRGKLSRKRFLAGAVPAVASVPLAQQMLGGHAGAMEREAPAGSPHAHGATGAIAATEEELHLLVPPRPAGHEPGRVREVELTALERTVRLLDDVTFDAWTYGGTVPGPILRVAHDDVLKVTFTNETPHAHSIHFHGTHQPAMDGSLDPVPPGSSFFYELAARPSGLHLYHCHTQPLAAHISKGLYGAFIVDPPAPRPRAQELVLVMSGFDTDGDGRNDLYGYNGRPFQYERRPIQVRRNLPVRIYLVNVTEYDPVVSFHLHAAFFKLYRTGTSDTFEFTDTVTLGQGERAVVEVEFEDRGLYMFHAHQSHLADKGLMGWFQVVDGDEPPAVVGAGGAYADNFADCAPCLGQIGAKALLKY
jgi:FtsP/CotA-like multicopper oxidase with cupredoxin domain